MRIERKFPKNDVTYSRKQMLEFNILIMQALFPESFTEKERKILVELCLHLDPNEAITKALKWRIMEATNVEEMNTLNTFIRNITLKQGIIRNPKARKEFIVNPVLYVSEDATEVNININLKRHDHPVRQTEPDVQSGLEEVQSNE